MSNIGVGSGMLSKALELWAFRVSTLCKSIQAKAAAMSALPELGWADVGPARYGWNNG